MDEPRLGQVTGVGLQQQQTITPQMQQSLKVLQAPSLELGQLISAELMENPVLEAESEEISLEEQHLDTDGSDPELEEWRQMEEAWKDYIGQAPSTPAPSAADEKKRAFLFDSLTAPGTLQEHLMGQLSLADGEEEVRRLAEFLIGSLDDWGFLPVDLTEMAFDEGLPIRPLREALSLLQGFDPPGVGAHDLRECLLIQLARAGREHSLEARIVGRHLEDLAMKRYERIAHKLGVTAEAVAGAEERIAQLDPWPARNFSRDENPYVSPDVIVRRGRGGWQLEVTGSHIPTLRISNAYKDLIAQAQADAGTRRYVREKIRSGKLFIRSVHQRQDTIEKIAREIIRRQEEFLEHGPSHLKPMRMAEIAEVIGVHETTVSRAVAGKYMATPRGVFELRYFFTTGIAGDSGESLSNTSVKSRLAELVRSEPPDHPHSDQHLVELLREEGIQVARRTIAKYRKELHILPSSMRRRLAGDRH